MRTLFIILLIVILYVLNLFFGAVHIDAAVIADVLTGKGDVPEAVRYIILGNRLPQATTALLGGATLAVAGLLLQTAFRNPLAGPSILGITSGASLGVALIMLVTGGSIVLGSMSIGGYAAILAGAFAGSMAIMALLLILSTLLRNNLMLLIAGIMIGYLTSSLIMLMNFSASAQGLQNYVMWGMGSFNAVTTDRLPLFTLFIIAGLVISLLLIKPLNLLLLGDGYALNLGVNLKRVRNMLLLATGILTATVTAYCGPVAFIGLAVPHIARLIWHTDNHRILMPATMLTGSAVALLCTLISVMPADGLLPINAVTPIIGAPVVIYVILRRRG